MTAREMFKEIKYKHKNNNYWVEFDEENNLYIDYVLFSDDCEYGYKQSIYIIRFDKQTQKICLLSKAIFGESYVYDKYNYKEMRDCFIIPFETQMKELGWL